MCSRCIYYLFMEFLAGRALASNVTNLLLDAVVKQAVEDKGLDWAGHQRLRNADLEGEAVPGCPIERAIVRLIMRGSEIASHQCKLQRVRGVNARGRGSALPVG
jgi:hypothetical protein